MRSSSLLWLPVEWTLAVFLFAFFTGMSSSLSLCNWWALDVSFLAFFTGMSSLLSLCSCSLHLGRTGRRRLLLPAFGCFCFSLTVADWSFDPSHILDHISNLICGYLSMFTRNMFLVTYKMYQICQLNPLFVWLVKHISACMHCSIAHSAVAMVLKFNVSESGTMFILHLNYSFGSGSHGFTGTFGAFLLVNISVLLEVKSGSCQMSCIFTNGCLSFKKFTSSRDSFQKKCCSE